MLAYIRNFIPYLGLCPTVGRARVTGRRIRRMRSLPTNVADPGSAIRWSFES